ncbi:MAG: type II toxin-antitoxin system HicA family toxin [Deltaproteobacteria bacterium]|nr:type II toxin-antitoxin system HicA family toxin [Deltaproteobacteria bacterium]
MSKLPVLSGEGLIKVLQKAGFRVVRQKGSHVSLQKDSFKTVVPLHSELAKGTLLGILKQCGMSKEDLENLLRG